MDNVVELVTKEPKSKKAMVELLYGVIDRLYEEEITYLEVNVKGRKDNCVRSTSIVIP